MMAMTDECCLHFCGEGYGLADFRRMMTRLVELEHSQYSYSNTLVAMVSAMWLGAAPGDADRTGALYIWTFS